MPSTRIFSTSAFHIDTAVTDIRGENPIVLYETGSPVGRPYEIIADSFEEFLIGTIWASLVNELYDVTPLKKFEPKKRPWNLLDPEDRGRKP